MGDENTPARRLDQLRLDRRRRSLSPNPEQLGCSPHQHRVADGIGGRNLQKVPRLGRKRVEPPPEALLDPPRERRPAGESETAR